MIELLQAIDRAVTAPETAVLWISILTKSTIILVATLLIITIMGRLNSAVKTVIMSVSFSLSLLMPILIFAVPSWRLPVINLFASSPDTSGTIVNNSGLRAINMVSTNDLSLSILTIFAVIWVIGAVLLLSRLLLGWFLMRGIVKRSREFSDQNINDIKNRISSKFNLKQTVKIIFSDEVTTPMSTGLWSHTIILPEYAQSWSLQEMEMSLTHELAHIKRYDTLWYLTASISTAIYWFNPFVWILQRRLVIESEMICDDYVLLSGSSAYKYAENLLGIARQINRRYFTISCSASMARKSSLEGRLMSIMSDRERKIKVKSSAVALIVAITLAVMLPFSGMQLLAVESGNQVSQSDEVSGIKQSDKEKQKQSEYEKQKQLEKEKQAQLKKGQKGAEKYPSPTDFVKVTSMPEMISQVTPEYPEKIKQQKIEGAVWVQALVDTKGDVVKAQVSKSSGNDVLDKSAIKAAYQNKYKPGKYEEKPIDVWVTYKVTFSLRDKAETSE